jgi:hypothetical protein
MVEDFVKRHSAHMKMLRDLEDQLNRLEALKSMATDLVAINDLRNEAMELRGVMMRVLAWRGIPEKRK